MTDTWRGWVAGGLMGFGAHGLGGWHATALLGGICLMAIAGLDIYIDSLNRRIEIERQAAARLASDLDDIRRRYGR